MLTPGKAREILHPDWRIAAPEPPRAPGRPAMDLPDGFARTLEWYREMAWIA
jgi:hypothetical protein